MSSRLLRLSRTQAVGGRWHLFEPAEEHVILLLDRGYPGTALFPGLQSKPAIPSGSESIRIVNEPNAKVLAASLVTTPSNGG